MNKNETPLPPMKIVRESRGYYDLPIIGIHDAFNVRPLLEAQHCMQDLNLGLMPNLNAFDHKVVHCLPSIGMNLG